MFERDVFRSARRGLMSKCGIRPAKLPFRRRRRRRGRRRRNRGGGGGEGQGVGVGERRIFVGDALGGGAVCGNEWGGLEGGQHLQEDIGVREGQGGEGRGGGGSTLLGRKDGSGDNEVIIGGTDADDNEELPDFSPAGRPISAAAWGGIARVGE